MIDKYIIQTIIDLFISWNGLNEPVKHPSIGCINYIRKCISLHSSISDRTIKNIIEQFISINGENNKIYFSNIDYIITSIYKSIQ